MGSFGATENNENRPLYLAKSRFFSGMGASQPRASYSDSPGLVPWPKMLPRAPPRAWAIRRHPQSRWARSWVTANYRLRRLWSLLYRRFGSKIVPHPHVNHLRAPAGMCPHCPSLGEVHSARRLHRSAKRWRCSSRRASQFREAKTAETGRAAINPQRAQASLVIPPGGKRTSSA